MRRFVRFTVIATLLGGGTVHGQNTTDPALDKLSRDFAAAFRARDAARVASFYTEDAVLMAPNQPMLTGRASIEDRYKREFEQGASGLQLKPLESVVSGAQGFEVGRSIVTVMRGGSPTSAATGNTAPVTVQGKYLVILRQIAGDWKIAYDIFNSDQPAP